MGKNKFFSKKRFFHMLTNRNEKSAYGSEIYLEKNSDMLSSAPLIFLTDLARISYHYGIRDKDDAVRLSGGKESDFCICITGIRECLYSKVLKSINA